MGYLTQDQIEVLRQTSSGLIGRFGQDMIMLIEDASKAGWKKMISALADLGVGSDAGLTQLGWWADGVEIWLVEP